MFTVKQYDALPKARRNAIFGTHTFIPPNTLRIRSGYYSRLDVISFLRRHAGDRKKIYFMADMLE